jgi:L-lactate dehydrogenase complex protein LldG
MSRERILDAVKKNQPAGSPLPETVAGTTGFPDVEKKFMDTLVGIGGAVVKVKSVTEIDAYIKKNFQVKRMVSLVKGVGEFTTSLDENPHLLENVELAVLRGEFGVAENGAVWLTEIQMGDRALPFIAHHLAMVINLRELVPTLHQAYDRIGSSGYAYGTFIAGPSKTADIEQSLVLGAHGPKSNTIFLLEE